MMLSVAWVNQTTSLNFISKSSSIRALASTAALNARHSALARKPLVGLTTNPLPYSSRVRVRVLWDNGTLDLKRLNDEMKARGADTCVSGQGGWLYAKLASPRFDDEQSRTAVFFRDNALVTWCTSPEEDDGLASVAQGFWRREEEDDLQPTDVTRPDPSLSSARGLSEEVMAVEQMDARDASIDGRGAQSSVMTTTAASPHLLRKSSLKKAATRRHLPVKIESKVVDGVLYITPQDTQRSSEMLVASLALASASRLNVVEAKIERFLKAKHSEMNTLAANLRSWHLNSVSDEIFKSERVLHSLRYQLNLGEADLLDVPEILWEFDGSERLFEQVVNNFDLKRRIGLLNLRLSYHSDFMAAFGEHVRHRHSNRLEKIIIILIAFETALALYHGPPEAVTNWYRKLFIKADT
ncbi:hypothetical protein FOZ61_003850 [Perkinsus olseni]|uniref:DUF155 domain-containing protein n=1 Tax=Perkinsus olseni TaxID=32597 RepID=A0A7J6LMY9_PEROL|nr:hypothetical protein FOZ61_003850 [Perkinsus olseni]KAF4671531.1 hypothetical protein FOL46_000271 [Perkinsus olseni]